MAPGGSRGAVRCPRSSDGVGDAGFAFGARRPGRRPIAGPASAPVPPVAGPPARAAGGGRATAALALLRCRSLRLRAVEAGDAARGRRPASSTYSRQFAERDQGAAEVPVLVEAVERGGRVVDQFDQAVPAAGLLEVDEELRQFARSATTPRLRQFARPCGRPGRLRGRSGPEASPASPRLFSATVVASENGVSVRVASVSDGRRLAEVFEDRRAGVGEALQAAHRLAELAQEGGELPQRLFQLGRRVRRSPAAAAPALAKKPATWARSRESGPQDRLGVAGQLGQLVALGGEDPEQAVDVAQHRVGALDQDFEVFAAAGEAGAEFVEDQPEALRVGQRLDVVDQVRVDAGAVAAERQQVLAGAGLAGLDLLQRRRRRASPAPAAGSGGSRRTSRRSATAAGSGSWRRCGSPGSPGR